MRPIARMHLQSLGCGFGASVRTRLSAGEAGAAPALGRRPTDPGTVTGTPRRPWHLLPARRASPASPPGSGGPPSAGMAVPLLRARAAEPGSHGDPARAGSCDPHWQTAARRGPGTRASLRPNRAGQCGLHGSPPWWSFLRGAGCSRPTSIKCKTRMRQLCRGQSRPRAGSAP